MKKIKIEAKGYGVVQRDFMTMDISIYAKCVYTLLKTYQGDKHSCYPSLKTICDDLRISKSTVIRSIKELEKIDMVAVRRSKKIGTNESSVNVYIPLSVQVEIDLEKDDLNIEELSLGGTPQTPRGTPQTLGVVSEIDSKNNSIKNNIEESKISAEKISASDFEQKDLFSLTESEKVVNEKEQVADVVFSFEEFWEMYGKKEDRKKTESKFKKLKKSELEKIKQFLPNYIQRRPDKKYRKNPLTWLNSEGWIDEEERLKDSTINNVSHIENKSTSSMDAFYSFQDQLFKENNQL